MKKTSSTKPAKFSENSDWEIRFDELAQNMQRLTIAVIVLIVGVSGLAIKAFYPSSVKPQAAVEKEAEVAGAKEQFPILTKFPKIKNTDYVRGNKDAQYLMITYTDLECPFCKRFHETMQSFMEQENNNLAWVIRHFPLDQLHSQARDEAIAAECVGKLGGTEAFWKFVDKVFSVTPSNNGLNLVELPNYAGEAGVDYAAFNNCYSNKETKTIVENDQKEGTDFGISGTPGSYLINRKTNKAVLLPGALPLSGIEEAMNKIK